MKFFFTIIFYICIFPFPTKPQNKKTNQPNTKQPRFGAVRSTLSIADEQFLTSFTAVPTKGTILDGGRSGSVIVSSVDEKCVENPLPTAENLLEDTDGRGSLLCSRSADARSSDDVIAF